MSTMEPVLADNALNHFVVDRIFGVWIGSMAEAIDAREVLIVEIRVVRFRFVGIQSTSDGKDLRCSAVTTERSFRIEFDHLMADMTIVRASQTHSGPLLRIRSSLRSASQTRIQCLTLDVTLCANEICLHFYSISISTTQNYRNE